MYFSCSTCRSRQESVIWLASGRSQLSLVTLLAPEGVGNYLPEVPGTDPGAR